MKIQKIFILFFKKYENLFSTIFLKKLQGLFAYNPIILSSVLIKRSVFLKFKFDENKSLVGIEDLDLWLRILNLYPNKIIYEKKKI